MSRELSLPLTPAEVEEMNRATKTALAQVFAGCDLTAVLRVERELLLSAGGAAVALCARQGELLRDVVAGLKTPPPECAAALRAAVAGLYEAASFLLEPVQDYGEIG